MVIDLVIVQYKRAGGRVQSGPRPLSLLIPRLSVACHHMWLFYEAFCTYFLIHQESVNLIKRKHIWERISKIKNTGEDPCG